MVHFTPLLQRGSSNSPYSIYDQLAFDTSSFPNGESDVAALVAKMESKFDLMGLTDVVWNHTANNSKWLETHPESGYNLETAPWLEAAEVLDTKLLDFGSQLAALGYPTTLRGTDDLAKIMDGVKSKVIGAIKLWEWYVVDVQRDAMSTVQTWRDGNATLPSGGSGGAISAVQVGRIHSQLVIATSCLRTP